jgi:hypothetical protein
MSPRTWHCLPASLLFVNLLLMVACGGSGNNGGGGGGNSQSATISSVSVSCNPSSLLIGETSQCTATVTGTGQYSSAVNWSTSAGQISSSGVFDSNYLYDNLGPVTINAASAQDSSKSGNTTVTAVGEIQSVSVSCTPNTLRTGQTSQCSATVMGLGTFPQDVIWSAHLNSYDGPACNCISATGLVTAPKVDGAGTVVAAATPVRRPSRTGWANIGVFSSGTITSVNVSCAKTNIVVGQDSLCTANVIGTGDYSSKVTWSVQGLGSIWNDQDPGLYMPYSQLSQAQTDTIVATAVQDGTRGQATITTNPVTVKPNNVTPIKVDLGLNGNYVNGAFASITICLPGTDNCQVIDHLLVDTGSVGVRLLSSAVGGGLALSLPPQAVWDSKASVYNPLLECAQFVSGYLWGSVARADVLTLPDGTGEQASFAMVQVIGAPGEPGVPASCDSSGPNMGNLTALGANGILGVGVFRQDCGQACFDSFNILNVYYVCSQSGCSKTSSFDQVVNPVPLFASDNNGVLLQLPSISPPGTQTLPGSMIFGINTAANNSLGNASVLTVNGYSGTITVTYNGVPYPVSFIDSGSNGMFFLDSTTLGAQMPTCSGLYCPSSTQTFTATNAGTNNAPSIVTFSIDNAKDLFTHSDYSVFPTLGGPSGTPPLYFDYGLPFFYGRSVFTAVEGASVGNNLFGPFYAY